MFTDQEVPYYLWNREITNTKQDKKYDVLILGDSVANAAYIPEVLSDHVINLALGGTTPVENYYTMQDWLKYNPAPKVCYISFRFPFTKRRLLLDKNNVFSQI